MKAKLSPNMISFITVRRGEWILKISVFRNTQIMIVALHAYEPDNFIVKFFTDQNKAADYIEFLAESS